ncbi:hypothetical protein SLA2020_359770 [Shorea laevis]
MDVETKNWQKKENKQNNDFHRKAETMAPMRKKNCSGRSQLRRRRVRFPISSSFCFRQGLFLPRLLPSPASDFYRRAETMAPMRKKNCSGRSQLRHRRVRFPISSSFCFRQGLFLPRLLPETQRRRLQKMEKWVTKQRDELIPAQESVKKDKAAAEEKSIKLAEGKRLNELRKKEIACSKRCIDLTLDIFDAEDQGDFARAELLKHSRSQLLAEMESEIRAFMNAGGSS